MKCAHINTRQDLDQIIQRMANDTYDNEEIWIHFNDLDLNMDTKAAFNNDDLQRLVAAINSSKWCQNNLKEINISNNQFTVLPDLKCESLIRLNINGTPFETIGKIDCPNLEFLGASANNSRVPPNLMEHPKLNELQILPKNPLSLLGIYLLLLQLDKKNMLNDPPYKNLAENFIIHARGDSLRQIPVNFVELISNPDDSQDFNAADRDFLEKLNVSDFLNNFKLDKFIFDMHVSFVLMFMERVYGIKPRSNVKGAGEKQPLIKMFTGSPHLAELKQEYEKGYSIFAAYIDGMIKRPKDPRHVFTIDQIINTTKAYAPTEHMPNFKAHNDFFWKQFQTDLAKAKEIFIAVGKPEHAKLVSEYEKNEMASWVHNFNVPVLILKQLRTCIEPTVDVVLDVRSGSKKPAKSWLNYFKMTKTTGNANQSSNPTTNTESTASQPEPNKYTKRRWFS